MSGPARELQALVGKQVAIPLNRRSGNAHAWGTVVACREAFGRQEILVELRPPAGWGELWVTKWALVEALACEEPPDPPP